jgi:hypothetical protein
MCNSRSISYAPAQQPLLAAVHSNQHQPHQQNSHTMHGSHFTWPVGKAIASRPSTHPPFKVIDLAWMLHIQLV